MTGGSDGPEGAEGPAGMPDPAGLLRDWMTLVQTELAGLATDREALETFQALAGAWGRGLVGYDSAPIGPTGAAAAAAAPAAGGDARIQPLLDRIDALERRVAELEQRGRRRKGGAG